MKLFTRIATLTLAGSAFLAAPTVWAGDLTVEGNLIVTSNVTAESYSGSGSGLTDVDAAELEGLDASDYVRIDHSGNVGDVAILGSFTVGSGNSATGSYAFAQGSSCQAGGSSSHAEGILTKASGMSAHAEGLGAQAEGMHAHAEGGSTIASGGASHAEGYGATAAGTTSHAAGEWAKALHDNTYVWADSWTLWGWQQFESTTNCEYSVRARNGVRFVTGSGAGVTVNGREVATLAYIPQQGDLSMGSFTNGLPQ